MKDYSIEVTETLQRTVIVTAQSIEDALGQVRRQYQEQRIILTDSHYISTDFSLAAIR